MAMKSLRLKLLLSQLLTQPICPRKKVAFFWVLSTEQRKVAFVVWVLSSERTVEVVFDSSGGWIWKNSRNQVCLRFRRKSGGTVLAGKKSDYTGSTRLDRRSKNPNSYPFNSVSCCRVVSNIVGPTFINENALLWAFFCLMLLQVTWLNLPW
ncbi:hypothetical protein CRG98_017295 [Punica granatum]|uniref:Uncharacterized protein n=1 Tax=Punica granatum TaxID=22663 RepID=A0A2I0K160_PUNGR|nr:hypothetical protein CRG98_017295 [Punica granatum]